MREVCNVGYGRQACEQFPTDSASDAIRFHIGKESGRLIQIQYVFEKDCWPAERGTLDYDKMGGFSVSPSSQTLASQAQAFLQSYLRRRNQA